MNEAEALKRLHKKYPHLKPISEAIEAYFSNQPVTSHCIVCGYLLTVEYIEIEETETTSTWVTCPNGCTSYHAAGTKKL